MSGVRQVVTYRHWLPAITRCPVNGWPDLLYVSAKVDMPEGKFVDLYRVRRVLRPAFLMQISMEELALALFHGLQGGLELNHQPGRVLSVTVRLAFGRHEVTINAE